MYGENKTQVAWRAVMRTSIAALAVTLSMLACTKERSFGDGTGTGGSSVAGDGAGAGRAGAGAGNGGTLAQGEGGAAASDAGGTPGSGEGGDTAGRGQGGDDSQSSCEEDAKACEGQVVVQCRAGVWTQVGKCEFACTGAGECSGACVPSARDCEGATPRECDESGQWQALTPCPETCGGAGNCIGECVPDSQDCLDQVPRACNGQGEWEEGEACPFLCSGSGECTGTCVPGNRDCKGKIPRECSSAGSWVNQAPCSFVCSGEGACSGACQPGTRDCLGKAPRECNESGAWVAEAACPFVCSGEGVCDGVCVPGSRSCSSQQPQQCNASGAWVKETACGGATPKCYAGSCTACAGTQGPAMVKTPSGFCIDSTEVTNAQYAEFLSAMGSSTTGQAAVCSAWNTSYTPTSAWPAPSSKANHPVAYVDWCDAARYCAWSGKRLCGKVGGGQVPNNITRDDWDVNEWIYACTAAGEKTYPYGSTYVAGHCNNADMGQGQSIAVKQADQCVGGYAGIYDMIGNVYEWVNACDTAVGAADACHIVGAAYYRDAANSRCDGMGYLDSRDAHRDDVGFRCCAD